MKQNCEERIEELERQVLMLTTQLNLTIKLVSRITTAVNHNSTALLELLDILKGEKDEYDPDIRIRD